jgi:hypothetical protein
MISVIICSRNNEQLSLVKKNIEETIGVPFEILSIDNSNNKYSICTAYNTAASEAKYETLCFMHEDIVIRTYNWGNIVLDILKQDFGLAGVAGSMYKSRSISGWTTGNPQYDFFNVYHTLPNGELSHYYSNNFDAPVKECIVLDGLWLCCNKSIWEKVRFNSALLKGFHFYDIDFSIRCSSITKVAVTGNIDIEHRSKGNFSNAWMKEALVFHNHYKKRLPVMKEVKDKGLIENLEKKIYLFWQKRLNNERMSFFNRMQMQWYAFKYMPKVVIKKLLKR